MKNRKENIKNIIIILLLVIIITLIFINFNNKNINIEEPELKQGEQLTQTTSTNAYVSIQDHLAEVEATGAKGGITYCGEYTANGSFDISDYGLSNVNVSNFIFVPTMSTTSKTASAAHIGYGYNQDYVYVRGYGNYTSHKFTLTDNTLSFTLPSANGSAYNGPSSDNVSNKVGGSWKVTIKGKIYYIN